MLRGLGPRDPGIFKKRLEMGNSNPGNPIITFIKPITRKFKY